LTFGCPSSLAAAGSRTRPRLATKEAAIDAREEKLELECEITESSPHRIRFRCPR
jgi:hypothetical protein